MAPGFPRTWPRGSAGRLNYRPLAASPPGPCSGHSVAPTCPQTKHPNSSPGQLRTSGPSRDAAGVPPDCAHLPTWGPSPRPCLQCSPTPPPISWTHPIHPQAPAPMPPPPGSLPSPQRFPSVRRPCSVPGHAWRSGAAIHSFICSLNTSCWAPAVCQEGSEPGKNPALWALIVQLRGDK